MVAARRRGASGGKSEWASAFGARFAARRARSGIFPAVRPDLISLGSPRSAASAVARQRSVAVATRLHGLTYGMGYAWTTGRGDGLGASGQDLQGTDRKIQNPLRKHAARGDWELLPGSSLAEKKPASRQAGPQGRGFVTYTLSKTGNFQDVL